MKSFRTLFTRRREPAYAGVLSGWTVCRDVGGTYYRGVIDHDQLGRFDDGERMSTGYVDGEADSGGLVRATDALYRLGSAAGPSIIDAGISAKHGTPARRKASPPEKDGRAMWDEPSSADGDSLAHFQTGTHFELLFRSALQATQIRIAESPRVLVLGAGTGANAVGPCLRLFRGAQIVATDPSEAALAALLAHARLSGVADRVTALLGKADDPPPSSNGFDLVAGVSVLHRLVDPDRALAHASQALKCGGHAIFMEPFEGYGLIRLAFEQICAQADLRKTPLPSPLRSALAATIADIAARTMPDPIQPSFAEMDQKWLFSREAIAAAAQNLGFSASRFVSHNDHATFYRDVALVLLSKLTGESPINLPNWAIAILEGFDRALTPAVKRLLMLEGSIVLTRGPEVR